MFVMELLDEIMFAIFAQIDFRSMLNCRAVCKKWYQIINNEKRLMNRILFDIDANCKSFLDQPETEIISKYTNLKLNGLEFAKTPSDSLLTLLSTVKELKLIGCALHDQNILTFLEIICNGSKNNCLDQFEIDGIERLPLAGSECLWPHVSRTVDAASPSTIIKNMHVKITNMQTNTIFEHLIFMTNVIVQRMSIEIDDSVKKVINFHYELMHQFLHLVRVHFQYFIKTLSINLAKANWHVLDSFYRRLTAMEGLELEVLVLKTYHYPNPLLNMTGDTLKNFIGKQFSHRNKEVRMEMIPKRADKLNAILPETDCLKLRLINDNFHQQYLWNLLPILSNITTLNVLTIRWVWSQICVDFSKLPSLEKLKIAGPKDSDELRMELVKIPRIMPSLKQITIINVTVDEEHFRAIFDSFPQLEVLKLDKSYFPDVGKLYNVCDSGTSINNLRNLHTLWLDDIATCHNDLLEMLELPNLKELGFFKPAKINNISLSSSSSYLNYKSDQLKISNKTLKVMANNCPSLLKICDNINGTSYRRSAADGQFYGTQGYQSVADTESDVEHFVIEMEDVL